MYDWLDRLGLTSTTRFTTTGVPETATAISSARATPSAINNPYFYTGQRLDAETGLMYYKNRYYSPELGRFISRDPVGYEGRTLSLYEYSYSKPTLLQDPYGLQPPLIKDPPPYIIFIKMF